MVHWLRICLQCGIPGFDSSVGKIPWRREQLLTPVFWPGKNSIDRVVHGVTESDTTKQLLLFRSLDVSMLPMNTMDGSSRVGNYQMIVIQRGAVSVELQR